MSSIPNTTLKKHIERASVVIVKFTACLHTDNRTHKLPPLVFKTSIKYEWYTNAEYITQIYCVLIVFKVTSWPLLTEHHNKINVRMNWNIERFNVFFFFFGFCTFFHTGLCGYVNNENLLLHIHIHICIICITVRCSVLVHHYAHVHTIWNIHRPKKHIYNTISKASLLLWCCRDWIHCTKHL